MLLGLPEFGLEKTLQFFPELKEENINHLKYHETESKIFFLFKKAISRYKAVYARRKFRNSSGYRL